jgi:DNA-binding CsgD family transcriptional regulator
MRLAPAPRHVAPGPKPSVSASALTAQVRVNPAPHRTGAPPRGPAREAGPGNSHPSGRHAGLDRGDRAWRNGESSLSWDHDPDGAGTGLGEEAWLPAGGCLDEAASGPAPADAGENGKTGIESDDVRLLMLLAGGLPANAVARKMNLSPRTLRRRTRTLCDKIGVHTPIEAVAWAARRLLI